MFKIGDFSKLSQVGSKTLRYYDDIGLLKPAQVDRFTGYRYYTVDQLPRLNRIMALKELGFSLDQIAKLLEEDVSAEQIQGMLRLRQSEVEQHIEEEQQRLLRIQARLQQITQEKNPTSTYDVVTRQIEALHVASIRETVPHYRDVGRLSGALFAELQEQNIAFSGSLFVLYHDGEYRAENPDVELCMAVETAGENSKRVRYATLPAVTAASTIHTGSYETLSAAYGALMTWCVANQYEVQIPNREIYLRGPGTNRSPEDYVTEIQFPITKRSSESA